MLITFQHPLVDFRDLIIENHRISYPIWPMPDKGAVKYTGIIKDRFNGGYSDWTGDQRFCTTRNAIRYIDLEKLNIEVGNLFPLKNEGAFRRLFSDGRFSVKHEIGISNRFERHITLEDLKGDNQYNKSTKDILGGFLSECCKTKVIVAHPSGYQVNTNLSECGDALSELYLLSTTKQEAVNKCNYGKWWVDNGTPICIVEYYAKGSEGLPKGSTLVCENIFPGIDLFHYRTKLLNKKTIRTWIILCRVRNDKFIRDLRLNLLRINAEKATLIKIFNKMADTRSREIFFSCNENTQKIEDYIEFVSSKLLRKNRYNIEQKKIIDLALDAEDSIRKNEIQTIIEELSFIKNQNTFKNVTSLFLGTWDVKK